MQLWQTLVRTALLGTERQNPALILPEDEPELKNLLARIDPAEAEAALLQAAGLLTLWRRAGYQPARLEGQPGSAAPVEQQPRCRPGAIPSLRQILNGHLSELLDEWLAAVAALGQRAPEEHLPALLELGRQKITLRPLLFPVLGERGRWLAAQNPDWHYATRPNPRTVWETGTPSERLALIRQLRQEDPAQALALMMETWAAEPPETRIAFIQALALRLGPADEPFLEQALDDRRKEVRKSAAELLSRLPESRLSQRMRRRLEPLLNFKKSLLGGGVITLLLPEERDEAMIRDGVEEEPLSPGLGQRGWWLCQMVAAVPPGFWSRQWQQSPKSLITAARKSEKAGALLLGWAIATRRQRDVDWLEALVGYALEQNNGLKLLNEANLFPAIPALPPDHLESLLLDSFKFAPIALYDQHPLFLLLHMAPHPWSWNTARAVVGSLHERIERDSSPKEPDWQLRASLKEFARHVPPALYPELAEDWPEHAPDWERWANEVDEFLNVLQFRYEMLNHIQGR